MNPSVSIVTITQYSRFDSINILSEIINSQIYDNILEWVIVEGSKTEENGSKNSQNISHLQQKTKIPIKYIPWTGKKLGGLRQLSNESVSGDIIVCMDDDDFYFNTRVSHAVETLINSDKLIGGCSRQLIYDYILQKLVLYTIDLDNHSPNNAMAYKKEYILNHKYDESRENAEEFSFTNNFSEPMVQFDTYKSVILSSHKLNTFNKRDIIIRGLLGLGNKTVIFEVPEPITNYIEPNLFNRMNDILSDKLENTYDIVYMCGGFGIVWDPSSNSLGGSEQAVKHLSEEWAKKGKSVAVYANIPDNKSLNNVNYFKWNQFNYSVPYKTVIIWRLGGFLTLSPIGLTCKNLYLDLHDNMKLFENFKRNWVKYLPFSQRIDKVFFKSQYHCDEFEKNIQKVPHEIIMNGIRVNEFITNKYNVQREKYRFCYCSAYTRGLIHIVKYIWKFIHKLQPLAELHVYYGRPEIQNENLHAIFDKVLSYPGVIDHGRQPVDIISREKYKSNFHLYISDSEEEIDCISIRESLLTGAIPIISNSSVFPYREGLHVNIPKTEDEGLSIAKQILTLSELNIDDLRSSFKKSKTIQSWNDVSSLWLPHL